jgi:hypothetical protein
MAHPISASSSMGIPSPRARAGRSSVGPSALAPSPVLAPDPDLVRPSKTVEIHVLATRARVSGRVVSPSSRLLLSGGRTEAAGT